MHAPPSSTRYLSYAAALLFALLLAYGFLVLYTAYASGLSTLADPSDAEVVVPLYTGGSVHHLYGAAPIFPPTFGLGFLAAFWCVAPLCSLAILIAIVVPGKLASRARRRSLSVVLLVCWTIIMLTLPATNAFFLWLID